MRNSKTRLSGILVAWHCGSREINARTVAGLIGVLLLMLLGPTAQIATAATTVPVLWSAGGLDAGTTSTGQAARISIDTAGNLAVVSGPSSGRDLAVISYTSDGTLRWRSSVSPSIGTFTGDWIAASPNGDFIAVGHNVTSSGNPIAITMVRYAPDGRLLWRVDLARTIPSVARLLVDSAGNAWLAFNSVGDGQDIQVHKYSPSGALVWSQVISTGFFANDVATSLALGPDETDVIVSANIVGGASWITAAYNAATGTRKWLVTAAEGTAARDVVVDSTRVYVTGQGITGFLTVVAYDRATGARLWRTDKKPADASSAAGLRLAVAPDGSIVATGQANRGFLDWYTVAFEASGAVRWEMVRDGGLNTDEIPAAVLVTPDGTTVVTGRGGPNLPGGYIPGVTAGYSPNGTLLWEAFARMATVWETILPNGDVCATGGYDALITCWRVSDVVKPVMSVSPPTGTAPLSVTFDGSASTSPHGAITSWAWSFGDGGSGTGAVITHVYATPGTYTASLTVTDSSGASGTTTRSIVANVAALTAPLNLTATGLTRTSIALRWTNGSSNQTQVIIERCRGSACTSFAPISTVPGTATEYTDAGLSANTVYRYRVYAYSSGISSPFSNTASARTPKK